MFAAWALAQINQAVIEPGFIASPIQITAIIAIYNLQLSSACRFQFFMKTYLVLMKGDRLAALESSVFSPNNRCRAREQKHSLCSSPLAHFSRCSCVFAHQHSGTQRALSWEEVASRIHLRCSSKDQLSLTSSALFCLPQAEGILHFMHVVLLFIPARCFFFYHRA